MMIRSTFLITVVGTISLTFSPISVFAGSIISQERARALLDSGSVLSLADIRAMNAESLKGKLLDIEFEEEDGQFIYEFEILGGDGVVREFYLDATSGEIFDISIED